MFKRFLFLVGIIFSSFNLPVEAKSATEKFNSFVKKHKAKIAVAAVATPISLGCLCKIFKVDSGLYPWIHWINGKKDIAAIKKRAEKFHINFDAWNNKLANVNYMNFIGRNS
ncbi:hypothetical protein M1446_03595 [Candidatus Dependentiae bacterium]|nr:hypothetical protein [Candidatus Dependentiae bacterium]